MSVSGLQLRSWVLVAWIIVSGGDACLSAKGKNGNKDKYLQQTEQICEKEELLQSHSASCSLVAVRAQTAPIIFKKPRTNNSLSLIYFAFLSFILTSDIYFTPNKRCVWLILLATCHKSWRQTLFHCQFGLSRFLLTYPLKPFHVSCIVSTRSQFV